MAPGDRHLEVHRDDEELRLLGRQRVGDALNLVDETIDVAADDAAPAILVIRRADSARRRELDGLSDRREVP